LFSLVCECRRTIETIIVLEVINHKLRSAKTQSYFSQLFHVHRVSDVRQIEIHTAEPLVLDPSPFEVEIAIAKLKGINCQVVMKFQQI
jgi:hypothetical protein